MLIRIAGGGLRGAKHYARKCVYAVIVNISTAVPLLFASDEWVEE